MIAQFMSGTDAEVLDRRQVRTTDNQNVRSTERHFICILFPLQAAGWCPQSKSLERSEGFSDGRTVQL